MGTIPTGIEVLGIIVPGNSSPMATIFVPGHTTPFYVRENDIIGVNVPQGMQRTPSSLNPVGRPMPQQTSPAQNPPAGAKPVKKGRSRSAAMAANAARREKPVEQPVSSLPGVRPAAPAQNGDEVLFIKIGKITDQQVELHPVTNPENVRILR
jgi:hypothetical protein